MQEVIKISIKTNVISYNIHHRRGYMCKKGIIIVGFDNGNINLIDIDAKIDFTKASNDYIKIFETKKAKEKLYFKQMIKKSSNRASTKK